MPPAAITSASPSFAQVTPCAPARSSMCASAGVLSALVCGRQPTPARRNVPAIRAMLRSIVGKSSSSAGVSSSCFGRPTAQVCMAMSASRLLRRRLGAPGMAVPEAVHFDQLPVAAELGRVLRGEVEGVGGLVV